MDEKLQDTIRSLRRRVLAIKWLYGCGWFLSIAIGCLLLVGGVDFLLRQDDRLSRVSLTLLLLGAIVLLAARILLPPIRQKLTDVILAQKIQTYFPNLKHKLSTAVEFAENRDHSLAGSAAMRSAVIREATDDLHQLPINQIVHYRSATKAIFAGLISFVVLLAIAILSPIGSRIALARLTNPFGDTVWPKVNSLMFQNTPSHLPVGGIFEAEIIDRGNRLPRTVAIEYRIEEDGQVRTVTEPMKRVDDLMIAQRKNVRTPFSFRAAGGDDRTAWYHLQTVVPPTLETVTFEVRPPAYTGWPIQQQTQSVWGIEGSEVLLKGTASVPLAEATLISESGEAIPLQVESTTFRLSSDATKSWKLKKTGSASLRLVDQNGIVSGTDDRFSVRVIPESPPTVQIEKPEGFYRASPDAILPVQVYAKDNLAIRDMQLHFQQSDKPDVKFNPILLFEGSGKRGPAESEVPENQLLEGDHHLSKYDWDLATRQWEPGTEITFFATANDYRGIEGRSTPPHTLQIVSKTELAQELTLRQQGLLAELSRIVERQKESNQQTTDLEIAWNRAGRLDSTEMQALRGIELTEREIHRAVGKNENGLQTQITDLEADLAYNKIDDGEMSRQLKEMGQTLKQVQDKYLMPLQGALDSARKRAQMDRTEFTGPQREPDLGLKALAAATNHQQGAIEALQPLIDQLLRFNQYRRLVGGLAAISARQQEVRSATEQMATSFSGKDINELTSRQRVALEQNASQQQNLNLQLEQMLAQMRQSAKSLGKTDPLAAARLKRATDEAEQQGASNQMRTAGEDLQQNRIGQAIERQKRAEAALAQMLDTLSGAQQTDLEQLVENLRQAEAELMRLAEGQQSLREKQAAALDSLKQADTDPAEKQSRLKDLDQQRKTLEEQIRKLAARVENLQAALAAQSLNAAANEMHDAGAKARAEDAAGSGDQDRAAGKHLATARRQLEAARQQAEAEQLDEQLARLPNQLAKLLKKQQNLLARTEQWAEKPTDSLNRIDKANIVKLSRDQLALVAETQPIRKGLKLAEILQYVVVGVAAKMQHAAERLGQFQTDQSTLDLQQQAVQQLQMILKSLESAAEDPEDQPQGGGSDGGQGGGPPQEGQSRSLAEIRLLKLLQQDLNQRSNLLQVEIDASVDHNEDPTPLIDKMRQLGHEQAKLAMWTLGILRDDNRQKDNQGRSDGADSERREL